MKTSTVEQLAEALRAARDYIGTTKTPRDTYGKHSRILAVGHIHNALARYDAEQPAMPDIVEALRTLHACIISEWGGDVLPFNLADDSTDVYNKAIIVVRAALAAYDAAAPGVTCPHCADSDETCGRPACARVALAAASNAPDLVDTLRAMLSCRGVDDTNQESGETYRETINAALAAYGCVAPATVDKVPAVGDVLPLRDDYFREVNEPARLILATSPEDLRATYEVTDTNAWTRVGFAFADVTGVLSAQRDGEFVELWLTDDPAPYSLLADYTCAIVDGAA